ncbi:MAG: hypothetical protein COB26_06630 [Piscirickettsiaceae bacterium]|nr:MAG: hypothetical protein COB26_06630 [Piscirickettsiaceae bacterium]
MFRQATIKVNILLIILMLFAGQVAAQIHSVKHPFHKADQSCELFSCLIDAGHAPIADNLNVAYLILRENRTKYAVQIPLVFKRRNAHCVRAPPFFV